MAAAVDKATFLTKLESHKGLVSYAIKDAGIAIQTYYNWLERDKDFKFKVNQINEGVIDWVESKLYDSIELGQKEMITLYLKAKARQRGYTDKIIVDGSIEHKGGIQINFGGKLDDKTNK